MSHDLVFLIGRCGIDASEQLVNDLRVISSFNVQTRYENEKFDFYKLATVSYVKTWEKRGMAILQWIQEQQSTVKKTIAASRARGNSNQAGTCFWKPRQRTRHKDQ
jgi:hypothetical protein